MKIKNAIHALSQRSRERMLADTPSPCLVGPPDQDGTVDWQVIPIREPIDFTPLEETIGGRLHADVKEFYSSWLTGLICAEDGDWTLWLATDWSLDNLRLHLDGLKSHLEFQRREKQPFSIPIASTESSSAWFAVQNDSGKVIFQEIECPDVVVADCLCDFLERL